MIFDYILSIKNWFSTLFKIVKNYNSLKRRVSHCEARQRELEDIIKERTQVNAEVSPHPYAPHNVILTGRYKNRDYVEIFTVETEDLHMLIDMLRKMEKHARIRHIDTGPDRHMRRVFEGELDMNK